jgi:hypothetical protein
LAGVDGSQVSHSPNVGHLIGLEVVAVLRGTLKAAKLAITCMVSLQNIAVAGDRKLRMLAGGVRDLGRMLSGR